MSSFIQESDERNWVFATNSKFLIPISFHLGCLNLWYFIFKLFDLAELIVWNIFGLRHWVAKIYGLENQSLWQRLNQS